MITYSTDAAVTPEQFIDLLKRSTLAERRPVNDLECIEGMLRHADLIATAWKDGQLAGVARSVTDFQYCCYLSDLAVDRSMQRTGVGRELIRLTRENLGARCTLILLSAPAAVDYYPRLGFTRHESAWILRAEDPLK